MTKDEITDLEDAFFALISQVDYGDITNMDIYWDGILSSLKNLSIEGWEKSTDSSVVPLLKSLPPGFVTGDFVSVIEKMISATEKSSTDTFDPKELRALRQLSAEAEGLFSNFVDGLKEHIG